MSRLSRLKSASLLAILSTAASASAAPTLVALSGTLAPGGGTYSAFANPVIDDNGQVAFNAGLTGTSTSGLFTGNSSATLQAVALQGGLSPNGELYGNLYTSATSPVETLNNGNLAFIAPLTGGTPTSGVFTGTSAATLQALALQGTAAPAGGNYSAFLAQGINTSSSPLINSSGTVAFQSSLSGGTAASGIFTGATAGSLAPAALVGGAAPTPPGGTYGTVVTVPTLNANGQVAFVSLANSKQGIFAGTPGSLSTVMLQGTPAPAGGLYGTPTTTYSYNNAGQVGFISTLTGGSSSSGVFAGAPGSVQAAALFGGTAAGTGGETYGTLSGVTINGAGQVAFTAAVLNGGSATSGLFFGAPGAVQPVALANNSGTGTPGTADPDGSGATLSSFVSTELPNDNGQVVFLANLTGTGVSSANGEALFGGTPGNLTELVREGDLINLDPSGTPDYQPVTGFGLLTGSGGQDGKGFDFNDSGEVAYRLTFGDGSSGIFTSTIPTSVPEPTSLALLAAGAGLLVRRKRRASVTGC